MNLKFDIELTDEQLDEARRNVDPDLLREKDLKDKLVALRELSGTTNAELAEILGEKKRTFESWISGRFVPEGDKLKKVNTLLIYGALIYIQTVVSKIKPSNIYRDFPKVFSLLDFNDSVIVLLSFFSERGLDVDYKTGKISRKK